MKFSGVRSLTLVSVAVAAVVLAACGKKMPHLTPQ